MSKLMQKEFDANFIPKGYKLAHTCDVCNQGMREGFVVDGGSELFCSKKCLDTKYSSRDWAFMSQDEDSDSYFTEWEDFDDLYEPIDDED